MLENSVQVIKAVLQGDPTVSPLQRREYLQLLINGKPRPEPPVGNGPRIIRPKVAAQMLGRTTRSIHQLCQEGILQKVTLPGRKRAAGITESSLLAAMSAAA